MDKDIEAQKVEKVSQESNQVKEPRFELCQYASRVWLFKQWINSLLCSFGN